MRVYFSIDTLTAILFLAILPMSCNSHNKTKTPKINLEEENPKGEQIGQYIVELFEDSKGNLWFGTLEKGIAFYDGSNLKYLTTKDGLPSNRITSVVEDNLGNLWFGTGAGIIKYDGNVFVNFSEKDGLCSNMVSDLFIDSKGGFWIATWGGVCRFDGTRFEIFPIPYPEIETKINPDTKDWITVLTEDEMGNIWFGRDGYGASKFNGSSFVHFTTKDGLLSNGVQSIVEDNDGNFWVGTRVIEKDNPDPEKRFGKGGLSKYDGNSFTHFPAIEGISGQDVYGTFKDSAGNIWASTISNGVYKYDGITFTNYNVTDPSDQVAIMGFFEDSKGRIWMGCAGGLYRLDNNIITNITTNGPW